MAAVGSTSRSSGASDSYWSMRTHRAAVGRAETFPSVAALQGFFRSYFPDIGLSFSSLSADPSHPVAAYTVGTTGSMTYSTGVSYDNHQVWCWSRDSCRYQLTCTCASSMIPGRWPL